MKIEKLIFVVTYFFIALFFSCFSPNKGQKVDIDFEENYNSNSLKDTIIILDTLVEGTRFVLYESSKDSLFLFINNSYKSINYGYLGGEGALCACFLDIDGLQNRHVYHHDGFTSFYWKGFNKNVFFILYSHAEERLLKYNGEYLFDSDMGDIFYYNDFYYFGSHEHSFEENDDIIDIGITGFNPRTGVYIEKNFVYLNIGLHEAILKIIKNIKRKSGVPPQE